jgi:predicted membrane protein
MKTAINAFEVSKESKMSMLHHMWQTCKLLVMEYTINQKKIHKKKIFLPLFANGKIV